MEQVKKALRSIFRRNKKPKDGTGAQTPLRQQQQPQPQQPQQPQQQQRPTSARPLSQQMVSRAQTPEPATTLAATEAQPSPIQETNGPSPLQETAPVSAPPPTHDPPPVPQYANAPEELSSFPRSPSIPALSQDELESPRPEPQTSTEVEPAVTEAPINSHEVVHHTPDHDKEVIHPEHGAIEQEVSSVEPPVEHFDSPQADHTEPEHSGPEIAVPVEEPLHASTPAPEVPEVPSKTEPATSIAQAPAPATVSHEEAPHANEAARRAPPVYHDEKIPVMAEPPNIRRMTPAPGMVATSGPLEDFPFR